MEKTFLLSGLDCPNCSAKIEREVGELDGVSSSSVNLMKQTLTISVDEAVADKVKKEIVRIVKSHEPDVAVSEIGEGARSEDEDEEDGKTMIVRLAVGAVLFVVGLLMHKILEPITVFRAAGFELTVDLIVLFASYAVLGYDVIFNAVRNILRGRVFDENFLMSISSVCAFVIGEAPEAAAVMLFYQVGEFCQDMAVDRSRRSISSLMDIRPDSATVIRNGEPVTLSPEEVEVGETIIVKAGERVPLDGAVIEGKAALDTMALTGEALPRSVDVGDEVFSGCINKNGVLKLRVEKTYGESAVSRILDMVENASARKARTESFISTFARYYTPVVVILAVLLALLPPIFMNGEWTEWIRRGCVFLVISCPCALVISVPLTFFGGIGAASRHGVLVKGGNELETLRRVRTVVFDKTGTLTRGVFRVTEIFPADGFEAREALEYAAYAECLSKHPIAASILNAYGDEVEVGRVSDYTEYSGCGVGATVDGKKLLAGKLEWLSDMGISCVPGAKNGTKVYVAVDGKFAGCIVIADEIKEDSRVAIEKLRKKGVEKIFMLTGDEESTAAYVADELGLDGYYAGLLPDGKVARLEELDGQKKKGSALAFVGDGINDAPVLAFADLGIAMGQLGSDAAIEAADVVLMTDEPLRLAEAVDIATETEKIVIENIVFALAVKVLFLILGAFGIVGMWLAVFGDVGVALIAVLNAMRILRK